MAPARCTGAAELLVGGHQVGAVVGGVVIAVFVRHGVHGAPIIVHGLDGWRRSECLRLTDCATTLGGAENSSGGTRKLES